MESLTTTCDKDKQIQEDVLFSLYTPKFEAVAKTYFDSDADFIKLKTDNPDVYNATLKTFERLNDIWEKCLNGKSTMQDFERALTAWYRANMQAIKLSVSKQAENRGQQLALW